MEKLAIKLANNLIRSGMLIGATFPAAVALREPEFSIDSGQARPWAARWRPMGSGKVGDCGEFSPLRAPTLPEHDVLVRRRSEGGMPKRAECRPGAC